MEDDMGTWHLKGPAWRDRSAEKAADKAAAAESRRRRAAHEARIEAIDPALRARMFAAVSDYIERHGYIDIANDTATEDIRDLADDLAEAYERAN